MTPKNAIFTGCVFGFLSVAIGAFAAHGLHLEGHFQNVFETGVRYQFYHALALISVGILALLKPFWVPTCVFLLWFIGIILFSGSLYGIVLMDQTKLGMITPIGGVFFLVGWLMLIVRIAKAKE